MIQLRLLVRRKGGGLLALDQISDTLPRLFRGPESDEVAGACACRDKVYNFLISPVRTHKRIESPFGAAHKVYLSRALGSHDAASYSANVALLIFTTVRQIFDFGISLFGNGHRERPRLFTLGEKLLKNRRI